MIKKKKKILIVLGTRPEAIKLSPLIKLLKNKNIYNLKVCSTGQHKQLLSRTLKSLNLSIDFDLKSMKTKQSLNQLNHKIYYKFEDVIKLFEPNLVIVHGDTNTSFIVALNCFYNKIKIAHIESGLRTGKISSPWPEEANRKMISVIADYHFAPTKLNIQNLIKEGIKKKNIFLTGNTVIDAMFDALERINNDENFIKSFKKKFYFVDFKHKIILVTCHRRENFGKGVDSLISSLIKLNNKYRDIQIIVTLHFNPNVRDSLVKKLSSKKNIFLIEPMKYHEFIYLMSKCFFIISDSGGIQEEAPSLKKPVLILRKDSERPEAIYSGNSILVGLTTNQILKFSIQLLDNKKIYQNMINKKNPYGDGNASYKIFKYLKNLEF